MESIGLNVLLKAGGFGIVVVAAIRTAWRAGEGSRAGPDRTLWLMIALLFTAMACWALVHGDGWLHELTRARRIGSETYADRRPWQVAAIAVIVLLPAGLLPIVLRRARGWSRPDRIAAAASGAILGFTLVRTISLHQTDRLIYASLGPLNLSRVGDLLLVITVLAMTIEPMRRAVERRRRKRR